MGNENELPANLINRVGIPNLSIEYQQTLNAEKCLSFDIAMGNINRNLIFATNHAVYLLSVLED